MTKLELITLRLNELESLLIKENIVERIERLEKFMVSARDGAEGYYPSKKMEKEIKSIKKILSTLK